MVLGTTTTPQTTVRFDKHLQVHFVSEHHKILYIEDWTNKAFPNVKLDRPFSWAVLSASFSQSTAVVGCFGYKEPLKGGHPQQQPYAQQAIAGLTSAAYWKNL